VINAHEVTRRRALLAAFVLSGSLAACRGTTGMGTPSSSERIVSARASLRTVPETTSYARTSSYADVIRFLELLRHESRGAGDPLVFGSIGTTVEGRDIPYVIASRPLVRTPVQAHATGKPIVYVQANIHAGEVEGKEALLALLRDLTFARAPNVLDSIVLIAVPIYNADGNEKWGPQETQRTEQNGPELVGQRPNAQGLDLNRDYIKADAPETRASLAMLGNWAPDVFVDLHTTDGSFHGYALTYSPSLSPAAPLGDYTRELLKELRQRVRAREGYETFDYGNFSDAFGNEVSTDTVHSGWYTYDARPRFGTNYFGLKNRIAVLSEAFSHDPFDRRIKSTYAFTKQLLSLVAERGGEIRSRERATYAAGAVAHAGQPDSVPLRSALPPSAAAQPVAFEILGRTGDSTRTQPGVPRGIHRTGEIRTRLMPVFDRFVPTLTRSTPAFYLISGRDSATIRLLKMHGVFMQRVAPETLLRDSLERYQVDSVSRATRPFQGHLETRPFGSWVPATVTGLDDPLMVLLELGDGPLVMFLLDPESEDGLATWDLFDRPLAPGPYPVLRARFRSRNPAVTGLP
jgi:hypothetical protein